MAYRNGYHLDIGDSHRLFGACFLPQVGSYIGSARRTARAQDCRPLPDEAWQLPNVVAMLVADQERVYVCHAEPDIVQRSLQLAHANPAVNQKDSTCCSYQECVSRAAAAETRNCQQLVLSGQGLGRQVSALLVQGTLTVALQ